MSDEGAPRGHVPSAGRKTANGPPTCRTYGRGSRGGTFSAPVQDVGFARDEDFLAGGHDGVAADEENETNRQRHCLGRE